MIVAMLDIKMGRLDEDRSGNNVLPRAELRARLLDKLEESVPFGAHLVVKEARR
jgi:hypothetical protein